MSFQDRVGIVLVGVAALALGIDFLVSPGNPLRRPLLITTIVCGFAGVLVLSGVGIELGEG